MTTEFMIMSIVILMAIFLIIIYVKKGNSSGWLQQMKDFFLPDEEEYDEPVVKRKGAQDTSNFETVYARNDTCNNADETQMSKKCGNQNPYRSIEDYGDAYATHMWDTYGNQDVTQMSFHVERMPTKIHHQKTKRRP